MGLRY